MHSDEGRPELPQDNLARLKSHLEKDSLAEKLVCARIAARPGELRSALTKVATDRIEELRRGYELPNNKT